MKKSQSDYLFYNLKYTYNYETQKVVFYIKEFKIIKGHQPKFSPESLKKHFGTYKVEFKSLKEFKYALNNYSQYINEEIYFKHFQTYYFTDKYLIRRTIKNNWFVGFNPQTHNNFQNDYIKIVVKKDYNNVIMYISNKGIEVLKKHKLDYVAQNNKLLNLVHPENYPYNLYTRKKTTRKEAIKEFEKIIKVLYN